MPQTHQELKEAGYSPLLSRVGPYGPEYVYYKTPQPKQTLLEYAKSFEKPPQETAKLSPIEQKIMEIYEESPIKRTKVREGKRFVFKEYYKPTPEQAEKIVELAGELPPEKAAKYIQYEEVEVKEEAKGIAEFLVMEVSPAFQRVIADPLATLMGYKGEQKEALITQTIKVMPKVWPQPYEPVKLIAGPVASVESLVYGGERLISVFITHHEPITPRPPPTYVSGVIGAGLGRPQELERTMEYGPSYAAGTLFGDILVAYAAGKGVEKVWSGTKKIPVVRKAPETVEAIQRVVSQKVSAAWRGSKVEIYLIKHSAWYRTRAARAVSPGIISLPDISKMDKIGLQEIMWKAASFDLTAVPRTSGAWITTTTTLATRPTPAMKHLISRGGQLSIGYLRELWFKKEPKPIVAGLLTPEQLGLVSVEKHTFRYTPYIPKAVSKISTASVIPHILGIAAVAGTKILRRPEVKPKPIIRPVTRAQLKPKQPSVADVITAPVVSPVVSEETRQQPVLAVSPIVESIVTQEQETRTILAQPVPSWPEAPSVFKPPYIPKRKKRRVPKRKRVRRKKTKFGRYEILYPVATTREVGEWVLGKK